MQPSLIERYRGALLGLACGDAVGTSVEFQPRGSFPPLTNMVGGGPFHLKPGQWTDDTSMALCLAESLLAKNGFDAADQMDRYLDWWQHGHLSSTGECFDIGMTVSDALARYKETGQPFAGSSDPHTAGNGSLMRLVPVVLYYFPNRERVRTFAAKSSRTTHAAPEAVECCLLFADLICEAHPSRICSTQQWHHSLNQKSPPSPEAISSPNLKAIFKAPDTALPHSKRPYGASITQTLLKQPS